MDSETRGMLEGMTEICWREDTLYGWRNTLVAEADEGEVEVEVEVEVAARIGVSVDGCADGAGGLSFVSSKESALRADFFG